MWISTEQSGTISDLSKASNVYQKLSYQVSQPDSCIFRRLHQNQPEHMKELHVLPLHPLLLY